MNEIRYASLSGSLLARKGGAKPAMRPQPFAPSPLVDDLGWNDHGDDDAPAHEHVPSSIAALTPAPKLSPAREEVVHAQQRALSDHFEAKDEEEPAPEPVEAAKPAPVKPRPATPRRPASARPAGQKAAFTLRLDAERHLRLRLASAVKGKSAQQLVTAALDTFLDDLPEVGKLASQLPGRGSH